MVKIKFVQRLLLVTGLAYGFTAQADDSQKLAQWLQGRVDAHPEVRAAEAGLQAAQARLRAAGKALFNPQLDLEVEEGEVKTSQIGLSQEIDWGDQRGSRSRVAEHRQQAASLAYRQTRHEVAARLLTALAEWDSAQSIQQLAQQRLELMSRFAELARLRQQAGDLSQVEADLATLALSEARFQAAIAASQQAASEQTLLALTGGERNFPALLKQLPVLQLQEAELDALLQQLPAVQAARAQLAAARAGVELARSEASANPTLGLRGGKEGDVSLIAFNLSIPLQLRNNFQAEVDAANAEYLSARSEADNVYRQADSRLRTALRAYQLSLAAWQSWLQTGERSLSTQISLLQRLWQTGELSTTDYLVQLKQALDTQAVAYEQRSMMWRDWAEWLRASGRIQQWLQTPGSQSTENTNNGETAVAGEE